MARTSWLCLALAWLTAGCQTYEPQPIERGDLDAALGVVELDKIAREWGTREQSERRMEPLRNVTIDPEDGLDPLEVACLAVVLNPNLRAARARRGLAAAQVIQAGLLPNPQLSASLTPPTGGPTSGLYAAAGVGLSWNASALLTQSAGLASARASDRAAALDLVWQEWQLASAARLAATQAMWQERARTLLAEEVASASETRDMARANLEARLITQPEMDVVNAMLHGFTVQLRAAERRRDVAFTVVKRSVGLAPSQEVEFHEGSDATMEPIPSVEAAFALAREARPDLAALRAGYDAQEESVRAAVLSQFPRFSINVNWARDSGNVDTTGPGVTINLPIFNRGQGRIAAAEATRDRLHAEYVAREFSVRADLTAVLAELVRLEPEIAAQRQFVTASETLSAKMNDNEDHQLVGMISAAQRRAAAVTSRLELLALQQRRSELTIGLDTVMGRLSGRVTTP